MKKVILSLTALFTLGLMLAIPAKSWAQQKVAIVNLQKALNSVEEGKKAMSAIQGDIAAKKKQLETMKEELKVMRDEIEKKKMVLSKEALEQKGSEIQTKFLALQQKAMEYDTELKKKEGESVQRILTKLRNTVLTLAKTKDYDMVFENSAEVVLYTKSAEDITADVIAAYNAGK